MPFGSIIRNINVNPRTGVIFAIFAALVLTAFFGIRGAPPATAGQLPLGNENSAQVAGPDEDMKIDHLPGGPTGDPSIDLSHGAVHTSFSLGGTLDNSSPAYSLTANYSSNVKNPVKVWMRDHLPSELGLGWNIDHPRIIRMNMGTGREDDDKFIYYAPAQAFQELVPDYDSDKDDFRTYNFKEAYQPTTKIQRYMGSGASYWVVTMPTGLKYYYGGKWGIEGSDNYSDDFKQACVHLQREVPAAGRCKSGPIEYGVEWGDWVGASQNPKNQEVIEVAWNLSRIESVTGKNTYLYYVRDVQDVGRQVGDLKPMSFTRSAYLYRVQQESGAKTVLAYCPLAINSDPVGPTLEDEAKPASYTHINTDLEHDYYSSMCGKEKLDFAEVSDPHTESAEPDGYQERIKQVLIGGSLHFVAGSSAPVSGTKLTYGFIQGEETPPDMVKRILIGVQPVTYAKHSSTIAQTTPPTEFTYWGQDQDDGVTVKQSDFSKIFDKDTGAYYGAIKSITSSTGGTKTYTYRTVDLDISRHAEIPSEISYARTAFFSDEYIVLVGSGTDKKFVLEIVEWTARGWDVTYRYKADNYPHEEYDAVDLLTMQPTLLAFANRDRNKVYVLEKKGTTAWKESKFEAPATYDGKDYNHIIRNVTVHDRTVFMASSPIPSDGTEQSAYTVSAYDVDTQKRIIHYEPDLCADTSLTWATVGLAVGTNRMALLVGDRPKCDNYFWMGYVRVRAYVTFYDPVEDKWSDFAHDDKAAQWCLANTNDIHTGTLWTCAEPDKKYTTIRGQFVDDTLLTIVSGLKMFPPVKDARHDEVPVKFLVDPDEKSVKAVDSVDFRQVSKADTTYIESNEEDYPEAPVDSEEGEDCQPNHDYHGHCLAVFPFIDVTEGGDDVWDCCNVGNPIKNLDPDIITAGRVAPTKLEGHIPDSMDDVTKEDILTTKGTGLASMLGKWHIHEHNKFGIHPDSPLKYSGAVGAMTEGGVEFYSSYLEAKDFLRYVKLYWGDCGSTENVDAWGKCPKNDARSYDLLMAGCDVHSFDGEKAINERLYFNPKRDTGALAKYVGGDATSDHLSQNIYVNIPGESAPDLGCTGALSLTGNSLISYNQDGARVIYSLYPRIDKDGNSVMYRSLGNIKGLGPNISLDDIKKYDSISAAEEEMKDALKDLKAMSKGMSIFNYVLMSISVIMDIVTFNYVGLVQNLVLTGFMVGMSEYMQHISNHVVMHDQAMMQEMAHKMGTTHLESNFSGSRYTLHNTALMYRDLDGTIESTADLADDIRKDDKPVTALYIKKYDTGSGIVTFQTDHGGPYMRMLLNGTEGIAESISAGDNMTAGEDYDLYPMGQGRVFLTYEKDKGPHDYYTCLKAGKDRVLTSDASEDDYDSPCLFGARGKVFVHRVMDQSAMGNLQPVVVDTVTIYDGLQTTKVSYDFEASTAAHHRDVANFNKAMVYPGGRDSNNGRIEQLMYNGAESDVEVLCEIFKVADEGPSGKCGDHDLVDSKMFRDQLLGRTYRHSIFEHGKTDPQVITETDHKVQIVERDNFPNAFRVFTIHTDHTRDDVTTVTKYQYNKYGQKSQTDVVLNNYDWDTGTVYDEISSVSSVYAWETDAYGKAFQAANRYADVVQTTTRVHHDQEHAQTGNFYKIIGLGDRCLEATGDSNEANVQLSDCDGGQDQLWDYDSRGLSIKSTNGKCLEAVGAEDDTYEGNVQLYKCVSYPENYHDGISNFFAHLDGQQWEKQPNNTILTSSHDPDNSRCLDIEGGSSSDGTNVQVSECGYPNGHNSQTWRLVPLKAYYIMGPGGKCVEVDGDPDVDGTNVQLNTCDGGINQKWQYESIGGKIYSLSGKCMEAYPYHGYTANVQIFKCIASDDDDIPNAEEHFFGQTWTREDKNPNPIVTFSPSFDLMCLDVDGDAVNGANVRVDQCIGDSGSASQQWRWISTDSNDVQTVSNTTYSRIVGSKATKYEEVSIDGLSGKVYLPKRSYVYQTGIFDVSGTPDFDPSNPDSKWLAVSETVARDKSTGIPIATKNVQTGMVSSRLLTHSDPHIVYASFSNADAHVDEVSYIGFEDYESHEATNNFKTSGGSTSDSNGYAGLRSYGSESGKVSVTVGAYKSSGRPSLLSAWVHPKSGHTCQVDMDKKTMTSATGDGTAWQYLEIASGSGSGASVSCGSGGYIDEVLIRPVDTSFGSSTHDAQYRTVSSTSNNGVVTRLVRDQRNRLMGSYQLSPEGDARLLGFPIAGWSRYGGYGFQLDKESPVDFAQSEPNHVATIVLRDDDKSWFVKSWSDSNKPSGLTATPRFALRALVSTDQGHVNIKVGTGSTQLALTSSFNESTSETHLTLTQDGTSQESGEIPVNAMDRVLTWVMIDSFSMVFLDGKMVLHTRGLTPLPDSNAVSLTGASYYNVFIGQDPMFSRSFHDGAGRTIQSQSIRLDDDNKPVRTTMSQTLYDGWGKPSVQTKLVERDQAMGDYDAGFVTGFNWNLSTISGAVVVDHKKGYPFTHTRYASSPLLRPSVQSLLPGDDFVVSGKRAEKFSYGSTHDASNDNLLGGKDLYETQNFLAYTDDIQVESATVTNKAGQTVSSKHGNDDHGGFQEWKYQYDYIAGQAFHETTAYTPNYNAAKVRDHDQFKNVSTTWDNAGLVKSSQEPDLSGHAMVISDRLGRPRFTRKNVSSVLGDISGASYIKYDRKGRISEIGVLKDTTKNVAELQKLVDDANYPSSSDACVQTTHLYDADVQTGYTQPYLTGRLYGLVSTMNLIPDNPIDSCHVGEDLGHSYIFYQYDQRGRTIGVSEVTDQTVRNSAYEYDNLGNRLALVYPEKERMSDDDQDTRFAGLSEKRKRALLFDSGDQTTVYYPLNVLGQLDAICDKADCSGTRYASAYRYGVYGKITGNKLDGDKMTQSREYDFQERLTKLETKGDDGKTIFAETLSYDPYQSGNIRRAEYTGSGLGDGVHRYDYGYDIWGRLVSAVRSNGKDFADRTHKYEYTYDHNGNMLTKKVTGKTDDDVIEDSAFTYVSGKNQLAKVTDHVTGKVRDFTHNDYGAVTQFTNSAGKVVTYELHSRNDRVYKVAIDDGYAAEYLYDPLGRRIFKVENTGSSLDPSKEYNIRNADGQCIGTEDGGADDGTNIALLPCSHDKSMLWTFDPFANTIKSVDSGKCLDVKGAGTDNGDNIQLYECHGNDNQKWTYDHETKLIGGVDSEKCLDANDGNIELYDCKDDDIHQWEWKEAIYPGPEAGHRYAIAGPGDRCLDVSGSNVQLYTCHGKNNQSWQYDSDSQEIIGTGDQCLEVQGGRDGTNIQVHECHGGDSQTWTFDTHTGEIEGANNQCIGTADGASDNGTNVQILDCANNDGQRWDWLQLYGAEPQSGTDYHLVEHGGQCLRADSDTLFGNVGLATCQNDDDHQVWQYHSNTKHITGLGGRCLVTGENGLYTKQCDQFEPEQWDYDPITGGMRSSSECITNVDHGGTVQFSTCDGGEGQAWTWAPIPRDAPTSGARHRIIGKNDLCLDVHNGGKHHGDNVRVYECNGGDGQNWTYNSDSQEIVGTAGRCLDAQGSGNIQVYGCNGGDNQKWIYNAQGTIEIVSNGQCLDVNAADLGNGSNVTLQGCDSIHTDQWTWEPMPFDSPKSGVNYLITRHDDKCLDANNGGKHHGDNVQLHACNQGDSQNWTYDSHTDYIKLKATGRCLDTQSTGNAQLYGCNGGDNQKWTYDTSNGTIKGEGGKCLDVKGGGDSNGTNIQVSDCHGNVNQTWTWKKSLNQPLASGRYRIVSHGSSNCLDAHNGGHDDGDNVQLHPCNGGDNQKWTYDSGNESIAASSGKCLDAHNGGRDDRDNVQVHECNGGTHQEWTYNSHTDHIKLKATDKCLYVHDGSNIVVYGCDSDDDEQKWTLDPIKAVTMKEHDAPDGGLSISRSLPFSAPNIGAEHGDGYDDQVSAIELADGYTVEVYEHTDYAGATATYVGPQTVGSEELTAIGLNDAISSYKLYETLVAPEAPTNLAAESGDAKVTLTWDDPNDDSITGYEYTMVESGAVLPASPDAFAIPDSAPGGANAGSYVVTGLVNGMEYVFQIRAISEVGTSPSSDEVSATPELGLFPAPSNLISAPDDGRVALRWDTGDESITHYLVRVEHAADSTDVLDHLTTASTGPKTTTDISSQLVNGTEYSFHVYAVELHDGFNYWGPGSADILSETASINATPAVSAPAAPTNLTATPGDDQIEVTWDDPGNISIRKYQYSVDGGDTFHHMNGSGPDTTSFTFGDLDSNTEYDLAIRASNLSDESEAALVTATTTSSFGFSAPTGLIAMPDDERIALQWNVDDDDITNYLLTVSYDGEESSLPLFAVHPKSFLSIESMENGTEYTFSIAVMTDGVVDSESSTVTAAPNVTLPETPSDLSATEGTDQVALEWTNSDITVTGFQYSLDDGDTYIDIEDSDRDTSTYTITGLDSGTEYTVLIRAVNFSGEGEAASITGTTTSADNSAGGGGEGDGGGGGHGPG